MNKELIKKYKTEFDHWLNGGKVISKYTLIPTWSNCQSEDIWRIPDKNISKVLIVINDEYATYRKALAEGKIVEVATDYNDVDGYIWKSMEDKEFHYFNINEIRIKPEEPKFKVGDWVTEQSVILQIPEPINEECLNNHLALYERRCKKWEPLVGEVHWFARNKDEEPVLGKFVETRNWRGITTYAIYTSTDSDATCRYFEYCEPHIGTLPTKWRNK